MVSFPYYSHIFRGFGLGVVWETYRKVVPCPWESLKIPLMLGLMVGLVIKMPVKL